MAEGGTTSKGPLLRIEQAVSRHIRSMPLVCLSVPTRHDGTSDRGFIESNAIALLSGAVVASADPPSPHWLGRFSPKPAVRQSGLWNVRHVDDPGYDPTLLTVMESYARDHK